MASQEGHEEVVRLLLQSGAQDLPAKVQQKVTHQITESGVYICTCYCSYVESVMPCKSCSIHVAIPLSVLPI